MRLVVDSNILFTFFWKNSCTKEFLHKFHEKGFFLYSPEFSLSEIKKYTDEIIIRAKISTSEFEKLLNELSSIVKFLPLDKYKDFFDIAIMVCPDSDDADFFALAMNLGCPLWSNEKQLKNQNKIDVINTKELIDLVARMVQ
ncbi:MAG: PIN domain-containing protein [Candidatus Diapherotrites archaeon]|nr:PIN domain-containing protein [Candidatus Diapherotrites archaeon]